MSRMEARLGASSETLRTIHREMERDYYSADPKLVDPLLVRCVRFLVGQTLRDISQILVFCEHFSFG